MKRVVVVFVSLLDVGGLEAAALGIGCRSVLACPRRRVEDEDGGLVLQTLPLSFSSPPRMLEQRTAMHFNSFSCACAGAGAGGPFCSDDARESCLVLALASPP